MAGKDVVILAVPCPADDVVVVLHGQELPPAVFIGRNTKGKYLLNRLAIIFVSLPYYIELSLHFHQKSIRKILVLHYLFDRVFVETYIHQ